MQYHAVREVAWIKSIEYVDKKGDVKISEYDYVVGVVYVWSLKGLTIICV